ncbi:MAG: hypothetical protein SFY92_00840 [Verrucomicrobiae bacterium]|nr:hypothetical protein [Verrucomicrobiae bacterium]
MKPIYQLIIQCPLEDVWGLISRPSGWPNFSHRWRAFDCLESNPWQQIQDFRLALVTDSVLVHPHYFIAVMKRSEQKRTIEMTPLSPGALRGLTIQLNVGETVLGTQVQVSSHWSRGRVDFLRRMKSRLLDQVFVEAAFQPLIRDLKLFMEPRPNAS